MVRHIILWNLKEELSSAEKAEAAAKMKRELEGLVGLVETLDTMRVVTEGLKSSNREIMLDSTFADEAALQAYQVHPEHQRVAQYVRSVTVNRSCFDFVEE